VFSKPEFTTLPPYLFSGADFALIPSHDEPFGLVAVESLSVRVTFADSDDSSGSLSNLPQQSI
jgi:hypothetical protein